MMLFKFLVCLVVGHQKFQPPDALSGWWFMKWTSPTGTVCWRAHLCPRCRMIWWESTL